LSKAFQRGGGTAMTCANIAPLSLFQRETKKRGLVNARKRRKALRFFGKKRAAEGGSKVGSQGGVKKSGQEPLVSKSWTPG
jgi:hypothetical protein